MENKYNGITKRDARILETFLEHARDLSLLCLALTSMGVVGIASSKKIAEFIGYGFWNAIATICIVGLVYFVIDWLLGVVLPITETVLFSKSDESKTEPSNSKWLPSFGNKKLGLKSALVAITLSLLATSGAMSYLTSILFGSLAIGEINSTEIVEKNEKEKNDVYKAEMKDFSASVKEAKELVRIARKEKQVKIDKAIASKGKRMDSLYRAGNGWAARKLAYRISKAESTGDEGIAKATEILNTAIANKNEYAISGVKEKNAFVAGITKLEEKKVEVKELIGNTLKNFMLFLDFASVIFVLLFTVVLGLIRREFGKQYDKKGAEAAMKVFNLAVSTISFPLKLITDVWAQIISSVEALHDFTGKKYLSVVGTGERYKAITTRSSLRDPEREMFPENDTNKDKSDVAQEENTKSDTEATEKEISRNPENTSATRDNMSHEVSLYVAHKKLIDKTRRNWNRHKDTSESSENRAACKIRAEEGIDKLRRLGLKVQVNPETKKLSIREI